MIFDLENCFIVFNAGAGGNFIAGIVHNLVLGNMQRLNITATGSSHSVKSNRTSISFGTWAGEDLSFESDTHKEKFYLEQIKNEYSGITSPVVTWSHNYKNILLYKKYFKKSKILTIVETSKEERLTCVIMNITKTLLDKSADIPLKETTWLNMLAAWKRMCIRELGIITDKHTDTVSLFRDRYNNHYYELILYISIRAMMRQYGMLAYLDDNSDPEHLLYDNILYPVRHDIISYCVGEPIEQYAVDSDVILPYKYLIDNNSDLLIEKLSTLLDRTLLDNEKDSIKSEFKRYRSLQNIKILTDPVGFYNNLEPIAMKQLKNLQV